MPSIDMEPSIERLARLNQKGGASKNVCYDMMPWFGVQMLKVAANVMNKHSQTADKEWCSSLGVGRGTNNSSP